MRVFENECINRNEIGCFGAAGQGLRLIFSNMGI
jgi:hypothetical protein